MTNNYPKSGFCNIFCNFESSRGSHVVQACFGRWEPVRRAIYYQLFISYIYLLPM